MTILLLDDDSAVTRYGDVGRRPGCRAGIFCTLPLGHLSAQAQRQQGCTLATLVQVAENAHIAGTGRLDASSAPSD
jgi:hypothetical protein